MNAPFSTHTPSARRRVLHVGCGAADPRKLPAEWFPADTWAEVRLDIDASVAPDIIASITDMTPVPTGSMDAVWSSHNVEHLYPHEVPLALAEFRRVLAPGGFLLITLPDLQQVAELVAQDRLTEAAYVSPAGPITPLDMLYGHRASLAQGNAFMGHRGGFVGIVGGRHVQGASVRDGKFALWAAAHMEAPQIAA